METIVEEKPQTTTGQGIGPMKRHIVKRKVEGVNWSKSVEDQTLCGKPWDRLNPTTGDYCGECIALYQKLRPGWPLPGGSAP